MEDYQKNIVINLLAYSAQRDISPETLCKLSAITDIELTDQTIRLDSKQVATVWANAIHLSNDELFGLHFGESLQLTALGIVGDIVKTSQTVGEALGTSNLLVPLITDAFKLNVTLQRETITVNFLPEVSEWECQLPVVHILHLLMAFVIHEMDGFLLRKIAPIAIRTPGIFTQMDEFARVMRCKPDFHPTECSIVFPKDYWNEPIITANYKLQKLLLQEVMLLKKSADAKQLLSYRIHQFSLNNSYLGLSSLEAIASNFNLSRRTIQRRLRGEGTSFNQIIDEVRKDLAINYLKTGDAKVKEICYLLGYNELSSFNRAFKRWTGRTPGTYIKFNL